MFVGRPRVTESSFEVSALLGCDAVSSCVNFYFKFRHVQIPVAMRSKGWVNGRSLAAILGPNPAEGMDVCLLWTLCVVR